jgi:hypothetical protein
MLPAASATGSIAAPIESCHKAPATPNSKLGMDTCRQLFTLIQITLWGDIPRP